MKKKPLFRNKKNQQIYVVLDKVINVTNQEYSEGYVYKLNNLGFPELYFREKTEFHEKFEPVIEETPQAPQSGPLPATD